MCRQAGTDTSRVWQRGWLARGFLLVAVFGFMFRSLFTVHEVMSCLLACLLFSAQSDV